MTARSGGFRFFSVFQPKLLMSVCVVLLTSAICGAQEPSQPAAQTDSGPQSAPPQASAPENAPITIPGGTRLELVLTHPLDSKITHRGDQVSVQTSAPVTVGNQVVVPAGTFVQGKLDKLTRHGNRADILLQPALLVFPDGSVVNLNAPVQMKSDEGTAWPNPSSREKAGMFIAPLAGWGIGAAIGAAAHTAESSTLGGNTITTSTPKGLAIGGLVGSVAGGAVALVLLVRSRSFYVEEGSPLEMNLPQTVTLTQAQLDKAVQASTSVPAIPLLKPRPPDAVQAGGPPSGPSAPSSTPADTSPSPSIGPGSCSAGHDWCVGRCVSSSAYLSDSQNCGRCGNICSIGESCIGGSCMQLGPRP
jgi:hypothetical protein